MALRTSCTHCGKHFKVPDKTLGKQARCKICGKMFVIAPAANEVDLDEVEVPSRPKPPPRPKPKPTPPPPAEPDDPLDALAGAAADSSSHLRPVHASGGSSSSRHHGDDEGYAPRHRIARGAKLAMGLGITATSLAVVGGAIGIIAMVNGKDQTLLVTLGLIGIGVIAVAAALGMMAVVNGSTASRQIRQARHPLGGRSEASTGTIMGWIALGLVLVAIVVGVIWLSQNPDAVTFKKEVNAESPAAPKAPAQAP